MRRPTVQLWKSMTWTSAKAMGKVRWSIPRSSGSSSGWWAERRPLSPKQRLVVDGVGGAAGYPVGVSMPADHRRWGIENKAFNELTQVLTTWSTATIITGGDAGADADFAPGFRALQRLRAVAQPAVRLGQVSLKELAHDLDLALEEACSGSCGSTAGEPLPGAVAFGTLFLGNGPTQTRRSRDAGEVVVSQGGGQPPFNAIALDHREKTGLSAKTPGVTPHCGTADRRVCS